MNKKATTLSDIALAMEIHCAGAGVRNHRLKVEMAKWVVSIGKQMKNPWSAVLTYKDPVAGGVPTARELASMEALLRKHFSNFVHGLSRKAYRNANNRHKKLIKFVAFFELGDNDRFHIHVIFDVPMHANPSKNYDTKFRTDVNALWGWHGIVTEAEKIVGNKAKNQSDEEALEAACMYLVKLLSKYTASGSYTDALLLVE